ncbi:MAG TPA: hypothetical protein VMU84_20685 [Thermoanaerobaculia bacterium]|nr:hypothetical protein [Thermoanaerobaculia bacterium]
MKKFFALVLLIASPLCAQIYGDGGLATNTAVTPMAVAVDAGDNIYFADVNNRAIRMIDAHTGVITTVLTNASTQGSGTSLAFDAAGRLLVADTQGVRVYRVDLMTGERTTIAGTGWFGFSGDGGPATDAQLSHPFAVALDRAGNIFIAEWTNHRIRRVDTETGIITTFAGNGSDAYSGDGGLAIDAGIPNPSDIAIAGDGAVYIADWANNNVNRIRRVDGMGVITTVAGNGSCASIDDGDLAMNAGLCAPFSVALDANGDLVLSDIQRGLVLEVLRDSGRILNIAGNGSREYNGDQLPAKHASLFVPIDVAIDSQGNVIIADELHNRVRKVDAQTGIITTIAGNGVSSSLEHRQRRMGR